MKFKRIIVAALLLTLTITLFGCEFLKPKREGIAGDVEYYYDGDHGYIVTGFTDIGKQKDIIYVLDEVAKRPVTHIGLIQLIGAKKAVFECENIKKIYFPWSIVKDSRAEWFGKESLQCIVSASTREYIYIPYEQKTYVVPSLTYKSILETGRIGNDIDRVHEEHLLPANISYFFNYDDSPNENYFFVDLLEETGKLTKPPYDPKREGYTFGGWYTEAECVNPFNFEEDSVTINFDEEGNRIYEEFCLYAKWDKK